MGLPSSAGIRSVDAVYYFVSDLERSRRLFVDQLDFSEIAAAEDESEARVVFEADRVRFVCVSPKDESSEAARWLSCHPEGMGCVAFRVRDAEEAFRFIEGRGGNPVSGIQEEEGEGGLIRWFDITTPFGDARWRFIERGEDALLPGLPRLTEARGGSNRFRFRVIDHITSNFRSMRPALLWMEHVMGFEQYWDIAFHTSDMSKDLERGSGLKSVVMRDPVSGVKFANNEPAYPFFDQSQIKLFIDDLRGEGIQHIALITENIIETVSGLRERELPFFVTPDSYYELLPERLERIGVQAIDEEISTLQRLGILVDGAAERKYMLQIFLQEMASIHQQQSAGPFFFEIIQRKGDPGFGGGNFRALFESIERQQEAR